MIGYLQGRVLRIQRDRCWLLAGNVGYLVSVGLRLANTLEVDQGISLWIESMVHDGQTHLFGFITTQEQEWFQGLISVTGVGGRLALGILSSALPQVLAEHLRTGDAAALRTLDGVGPKLAQRLITELGSKAQNWLDSQENSGDMVGVNRAQSTMEGDVVMALVALGYGRNEAQGAVLRLRESSPKGQGRQSLEAMLTQCLSLLSSG